MFLRSNCINSRGHYNLVVKTRCNVIEGGGDMGINQAGLQTAGYLKNKGKVVSPWQEKSAKIKIGVYLITLWILIVSSSIVIATTLDVATGCAGVLNIYANSARCDNMTVSAKGIVSDVEFKIATTENSNPYTVFQISDGSSKLQVFSFSHLDVRKDDIVEVVGTFHELYTTSTNHIITNQIMSTSDLIKITHGYLWYEDYRILIIIPFICVGATSALYFGYYKPRKKRGKRFEKYVLSLFDDRDWKIKHFAQDMSGEIKRNVASDSWPDIIVQHRKTNQIIGIQCKYFSMFSEGADSTERKLPFKSYQLTQYKTFQTKERYPTFIAAGVGGIENSPQKLYIIPLTKINVWLKYDSTYLPEKIFNDHEFTPKQLQIEDFILK